MTKFLIFFTAFVVTLLLPASAYASGNFSFNYGDNVYKVDNNMVDSWAGFQTLFPSNILKPPLPLFSEQAKNFAEVKEAPAWDANPRYHYRFDAIYNYVSSLAATIDATVTEPSLKIEGSKAVEFTPPQNGQELDVYQSALSALYSLEQGATSSPLTVNTTFPKTSLANLNNLGINELIGHGVSKFNGSPKNRRFNIKVGVEKMQGIIVPQGATFSFDDNLGPVDGEHGFLPELVIKANDTIPEFGGGLCQVSTTTFRAAMDAGVPITARRNHAYAVQYYAPQGTDATIYPGSADLKFVNDTPGAILIWPYESDTNTLVFDFYGTKDDRQVVIDKPVQYDRKPDGSMKATWTRHVTKDGVTRDDVFKSVYRPPADFHRENTFVSATGTPISNLSPSAASLQMPAKVQ